MRKPFLIALFCLIAVSVTSRAMAGGFGFYGTGGVNLSTWKYKGASANSTDYFYGGGIVIDSVVAKNKLFGYRFAADYQQYVLTGPGASSSKPAHRFGLSHTFGYGVARNENIRFWLGPQFGFHYAYLRGSGYKLDVLGVDVLLAMGLNVHIGDAAAVFFELGFGYMGNYNLNASEIGHGFGAQAKMGFMFRFNDKYASAAKPVPDEKIIN